MPDETAIVEAAYADLLKGAIIAFDEKICLVGKPNHMTEDEAIETLRRAVARARKVREIAYRLLVE